MVQYACLWVCDPVMEKYFLIVKDIILSLAALTGAIVAVRGLSAWKRQLSGKRSY